MEQATQVEIFPGDDSVLPFQVGDTPVRGRIVRLGPVIDQILSAHPFDDAVLELLGEASALVAMMGAALKFDGKLIFQAKGEGRVSLLVADYHADGALRATASAEPANPREGVSHRGLGALMGAGHIAMTIDQGPDMERYQGITPIEGVSLEAAGVAYFDQSEQIPTAIKLAVGRFSKPGAGEVWRAGGIVAQFIPGEGGRRARGEAALRTQEDREAWDRAAALLQTTQADELLDPAVSAQTLLYRLFHEDGVRVFDRASVRAACGCNAEKIAAVLERYSADDLDDMVEDGVISVSCEFCRTAYLFDREGRVVENAAAPNNEASQ